MSNGNQNAADETAAPGILRRGGQRDPVHKPLPLDRLRDDIPRPLVQGDAERPRPG